MKPLARTNSADHNAAAPPPLSPAPGRCPGARPLCGLSPVPVAMFRIDQKLIHGQVISGWAPYLRLNEIVVADEPTTHSSLLMSIAASGVPGNIGTTFVSPGGLPETLEEKNLGGPRTLVIFKDVAGAFEALDSGLKIDRLNLGHFAHMPGTRCVKISASFTALENELALLTEMAARGVEIYAQILPGDPAQIVRPASIRWPWSS